MLGCIQPMSSPMMNMMLGFASCAIALGAVSAVVDASAASAAPAVRVVRQPLREVSSVMGFSLSDNASEPDVACRRVDVLGVSRGGPVAAAVIGRAEVRSAFQHPARNADFRLAGIVALHLRSAAGILRHAA